MRLKQIIGALPENSSPIAEKGVIDERNTSPWPVYFQFRKVLLVFCEVPGWRVVRRIEESQEIFVANEKMFTLWQVSGQSNAFDRRDNVDLHHVALSIRSEEELTSPYEKLQDIADVNIELGPELAGDRPAKHMIRYEPGGFRVEFIGVPE